MRGFFLAVEISTQREILQKGIGSWAQKGNSRYSGTCGCRKDHTGRSNFISDRYAAAAGQSGPSGCLSGYGCDGAGPGITIFSKQAKFALGDFDVTLLDTPGHVDFSAEMERTLQVLDYAVLVISGADGVQGHVETLWRLLSRYQIPTILFINKMDQEGTDEAELLCSCKTAE